MHEAWCSSSPDWLPDDSKPSQIPRSTSAWETFGFILKVVSKFCKVDLGQIQAA